jgi:preprotein translocase subunit SecD
MNKLLGIRICLFAVVFFFFYEVLGFILNVFLTANNFINLFLFIAILSGILSRIGEEAIVYSIKKAVNDENPRPDKKK